MKTNQRPIGIIDSGIGGFTVVRALRQLLPREDILYLGDGANAPYGNRPQEELTALAEYMVDFMNNHRVKLLLVACNTISCLAPYYEKSIVPPVLYVVKSGAKGVAKTDYNPVAVISTNFTHQQGLYPRYIKELAPEKEVLSVGSTHLVRLIEENQGDDASATAIKDEIQSVLAPLLSRNLECCVLGCTHYPLALRAFQECCPDLPFSDPAQEMAQEAKALLTQENLLHEKGGKLTIFTTGEPDLQLPHLKRSGLVPDLIAHHPPYIFQQTDEVLREWRGDSCSS